MSGRDNRKASPDNDFVATKGISAGSLATTTGHTHPPLRSKPTPPTGSQIIEDSVCPQLFADASLVVHLSEGDEARSRTCSRHPLLRLLYVGIALLLRNVGGFDRKTYRVGKLLK